MFKIVISNIFFLLITLNSSFAQQSTEVVAEGQCSSSAKKQSIEILTKKAAVKECAKNQAMFLASEKCHSLYGIPSSKEVITHFIGCDKNEFLEDETKMIEYKCSYELKIACRI